MAAARMLCEVMVCSRGGRGQLHALLQQSSTGRSCYVVVTPDLLGAMADLRLSCCEVLGAI
jgi:hypothetical protein